MRSAYTLRPQLLAPIALVVLFAACSGPQPVPTPQVASAEKAGGGEASALVQQIRLARPSLLAGLQQGEAKKAVMREIAQSLGERCDDCHDISDFSATTVSKKIATHMYTHFSLAMEWKDGSAVTCASCHHGQAKYLGDRADKDRIRGLMQTQFVERLRLKGGGQVTCETCHGRSGDKPFLPRT